MLGIKTLKLKVEVENKLAQLDWQELHAYAIALTVAGINSKIFTVEQADHLMKISREETEKKRDK